MTKLTSRVFNAQMMFTRKDATEKQNQRRFNISYCRCSVCYVSLLSLRHVLGLLRQGSFQNGWREIRIKI